MKPTRHKFTILKQVVERIPGYLVSKLSKKHGVDKRCRSISPWSHVVSLVYTQLSHALSLNDVCDSLHNHESALSSLRGATAPSRNGLSHANRNRNADMAEELFWSVLSDLQKEHPTFGYGRKYRGIPRRFKRLINVVDSTTISLVSNCIDWAKHRRQKAAAKCHMMLDLHTFLPRFAVVKSAKSHDAKVAKSLCSGIKAGEIVVFDKAYVDFTHLHELHDRNVFWVTRAKDNMSYRVKKRNKCKGRILRDVLVRLDGQQSKEKFSENFRLIEAVVVVNKKDTIMTFITNNMDWSANSVCDLYKARWGVEVFFKQLKQTLQLADFLGHNENAVRWQVWTALLTYILLRFIAFLGKWKGSFARLFTTIRGVLWSRFDLFRLLKSYGTAEGRKRMHARPEQLYFPGLEQFFMGQHAYV